MPDEKKAPRHARKSFGEPYRCRMDWPEVCPVQCGDRGVVLPSGALGEALGDPAKAPEVISAVLGGPLPQKSYRTAFFEAFPSDPQCFVRGEGASVEEAEAKAWDKWRRIKACDGHEFDRRGREDGYAYCRKCPYSAMVFKPTTSCSSCGEPARHAQDDMGRWYCEADYYKLDYDALLSGGGHGFRWDSPRARRESFVRDRTIRSVMAAAGMRIGNDEAGLLLDALMKAEVWSGLAPWKEREDDGEPATTKPDAEMETIYLEFLPRALAWVLAQKIPEGLGESVGKIQAHLASDQRG